MMREIRLSEARRQLSRLLRRIEADPEVGYRILVRDRVLAELRSPEPRLGRMNAGAALLKLTQELPLRSPRRAGRAAVTSENFKDFLYGRSRSGGSPRGR